jgi:Glyoxalase-like domain
MADQLRLRQICLVAAELEPAIADIGAIFGINICHRDPNVASFGVHNALLVAGTTFIEVIAPTEPGTAAGRFLERSGGRGGYIALFDCPDPKAREAHANALGVATAFTIDRPGVYQCVQLHPRDCRATMLEFDRSEGGEELTGNYWPAGGHWQPSIDTRVTRGVIGIEASSGDPTDLARHWSAIVERPVGDAAGIPTITVDGATIGFVASDDGKERLDAIVLDVAQPERVMEEAHRRGRAISHNSILLSGVVFKVAQ